MYEEIHVQGGEYDIILENDGVFYHIVRIISTYSKLCKKLWVIALSFLQVFGFKV